MYVHVKLLNGFRSLLWYKIPEQEKRTVIVGALVTVPLRKKLVPAWVAHVQHAHPPVAYAIRDVDACLAFPHDKSYFTFIEKIAAHYALESWDIIKRMQHFMSEKEEPDLRVDALRADIVRADTATSALRVYTETVLTGEQESAAASIKEAFNAQQFCPILLHGVTGSGKTEVYKNAINHAFMQGATAFLLLPEVSLARVFEKRLADDLPHVPIMSYHSATKKTDKKELWSRIMRNEPLVVVGVHQPLFLPVYKLGLIIVDEEHECGYQEKKHPKINTRDAALLRAQCAQIPIVLGSATPAMGSMHNVKTKKWTLLTLKKRFAGRFPRVITVPLRMDKAKKSFWISSLLEKEIRERLVREEQVIIFINRRGLHFFVMCGSCSAVMHCTNCSVSLTVHQNERLICHYCGLTKDIPLACPSCQAGSDNFLKKGIGTQNIVSILEKMFPTAVIARADTDTTRAHKRWAQTVQDMHEGRIDILVGTQTITKGYHFARVTLVGIIWADLQLHFPFYNASEVALQQLIQCAGRAGRETETSVVIVQCMDEHPVFRFTSEENYHDYYDYEIKNRQEVCYPPYIRFVEIELRHGDSEIVEKESALYAQFLREHAGAAVTVLGPTKPPVHMINKWHMRKIYCKADSFARIVHAYKLLDKSLFRSQLFFTPNPVS